MTRGRAFSLSSAYVLGMAATYAAVGTLMGLFGASLNLQAALQSPPVLIGFALAFVALSLAMFGFYELRLPQRWQDGLNSFGNRFGGGNHVSVVVMGALSALVVSPCVSAPLAGALIYISASGDAVLGGSALLALGLGMGVPLLVIGASGGHLLPRAGAWMDGVKAVFGVGLLAVAVWLLERVVPPAATLALWAALAIGCGVYLGALDFSPRAGLSQLRKAGGAFSFIYGVLLLIGAASGAHDPLKPLAPFAAVATAGQGAGPAGGKAGWVAVASLDEVRAEVASARAAGRPALLDLYADWCISCKVMERSVFPRPEVASRLQQFHLLRADVTRNDAEDKALLQAFGLFGPPSLVFFGDGGHELSDVRIQGEIGAEALAAHLQAVLDRERAAAASEVAANW
jgi:thiol:disulfide interchange protein DsbD